MYVLITFKFLASQLFERSFVKAIPTTGRAC